jgi:hypothetical protein
MKSQKGNSAVELLIYGAILMVILLFGGAKAILYLATGNDVVVTVSDKGERCKSVGNCTYLIYTDHGTFENRDSWLNWKFNSSDIYGDIKRDTKYQFHTNGIRVPFLSWYPNISKVQEVK